jgi:hypothetical protein
LVFLDNEGQFNPTVAANFVECVMRHTWNEQQFNELRDWFRSLGIKMDFENRKALLARDWPERSHDASKMHEELYDRYRREFK